MTSIANTSQFQAFNNDFIYAHMKFRDLAIISSLADYYVQNIVIAFRFISSHDTEFKEFLVKQLESVSQRRIRSDNLSNPDLQFLSITWIS